MKNTKRLLINTLTLAATSFLMRTVGVAFNVYLTGRLGAAGIGLFSLVTDVYAMALTFSFAGLPLASTRLTVEDSGKNAGQGAWIMRRCALYGLTVGCMMLAAVWFGAELIAKLWLGDIRTASSLRILALSLPAASVGCAFSGYFTARRTVLKYAAVQIFEQAVKIAVSVLMLRFWAAKGAEYACDAVALGITISQISSLLCAFLLYKSTKHQKAERKSARRASGSAAHCAPGRRRIVRALGAADDRTPADSRGLSQIGAECRWRDDAVRSYSRHGSAGYSLPRRHYDGSCKYARARICRVCGARE